MHSINFGYNMKCTTIGISKNGQENKRLIGLGSNISDLISKNKTLDNK